MTTTVLTISSVQAADAGNYQVIVANAAGSVTSAVATLTVRVPPAITVQPQSRTNLLGTTATFNVTASGTEPLSYQWRFNNTNLVDGLRISGAASPSLGLSTAQTNDAGNYTVIITNAFGSVTSQVAVLTILAQALPMGRVVHWGNTNHGEGNVPAELTNVVAIAAGDDYALAVKSDGTVAAWGETANPFGQTDVPVGLSGVIAVAADSMHSVALKADGTVVAWGGNQFGQTNVPSGLNNVVAISARSSSSLALRANGTVAAWGHDADGQNAPPAGLSNVVAVAKGCAFSLALKADSTVVAWGDNSRGQTTLPDGLTNVVAIAAGCEHSLALLNNGTVIGWGLSVANPPAGLSNVVAISAGVYHNLALKLDGTVVCWGDGYRGNTVPPPGLSNVIAIAAGFSSFALVTGADPSIALQPQSRTNIAGTAATFSVTVTGTTPLGYQWLKNGVNLANGGNVSGATSASLILANVQPMDAANYQAVVTNAAGSVTSAVATLTVLVMPTITGQPQSRTNMAGTTATFSVTATGTDPLSYQWRKGGVNLADGGRLSGATTA
ncbi:MAG: immunoglobulin domain-containing protein, partial [Verrucomicrobiota bacterium]